MSLSRFCKLSLSKFLLSRIRSSARFESELRPIIINLQMTRNSNETSKATRYVYLDSFLSWFGIWVWRMRNVKRNKIGVICAPSFFPTFLFYFVYILWQWWSYRTVPDSDDITFPYISIPHHPIHLVIPILYVMLYSICIWSRHLIFFLRSSLYLYPLAYLYPHSRFVLVIAFIICCVLSILFHCISYRHDWLLSCKNASKTLKRLLLLLSKARASGMKTIRCLSKYIPNYILSLIGHEVRYV